MLVRICFHHLLVVLAVLGVSTTLSTAHSPKGTVTYPKTLNFLENLKCKCDEI